MRRRQATALTVAGGERPGSHPSINPFGDAARRQRHGPPVCNYTQKCLLTKVHNDSC